MRGKKVITLIYHIIKYSWQRVTLMTYNCGFPGNNISVKGERDVILIRLISTVIAIVYNHVKNVLIKIYFTNTYMYILSYWFSFEYIFILHLLYWAVKLHWLDKCLLYTVTDRNIAFLVPLSQDIKFDVYLAQNWEKALNCSFFPICKPHAHNPFPSFVPTTHKCYILRHCTNNVKIPTPVLLNVWSKLV